MAQELFEKFLKQRGLKLTPERSELMTEIFEHGEPFEVDTLLFRMKQRGKKTSKATIYRTIQLMLECGLLKRLKVNPQGQDNLYGVCQIECAYDTLICSSCGVVIDFQKEEICSACKVITEKYGFELQSHALSVFGKCPACRQKK